MTKTVLITGGAGFIGSHTARALISHGWRVRVLDSLSTQIHGTSGNSHTFLAIRDHVDFFHGDIRNRETVLAALEGVDAVVHLAAETGTGQSMYEIERYTDVNVRGTSLLLDLITSSAKRPKKLIIASSRALYGEGQYECSNHGIVYPEMRKETDLIEGRFDPRCPICDEKVRRCATAENSKLHPSSVYGITKHAQEQLAMLSGPILGVSTIALRYQNVYGPGQSLKNPYTGILSIFSSRMIQNRSINIFEDGKESRDFVYIDDVVSATVAALEDKQEISDCINIGSGIATDVLTVAKLLKDKYSSNSEITISGNFRVGDIRHNFADITKAKKLLNWQPKISLAEGIAKFTDWVRLQPVTRDEYELSLTEMKNIGLLK